MLKEDKELTAYRESMTPPGVFEEGFSLSSVAAALFIGILMVPGAIYMHLVAGIGVGPAATWVTVILFIEVAKRTHQTLKNAQLFVLFYLAGAAMAAPMEGLIWGQFFAQSNAVTGQGMTDLIPAWFAPTDPEVLATRNFFQLAWLPAIGLVIFKEVISRIDNNVLGYGLFRLTSDIEKLPFPMAPVGAQGTLALAEDLEESTGKKSSWRWRVFAVGGALGLVFGFLYMGLPVVSQALLGRSISMFPIPFADWTTRTQGVLPAVATGLSFDLGALVIGMVIPFWAVVGTAIGVLGTFCLNPVLYHNDILRSWRPGDSTVETLFKNTLDFYFSFGLGLSLAIALIGFISVGMSIRQRRQQKRDQVRIEPVPKGRGDIPTPWILLIYLITATSYILVCGKLIHWHKGVMLVLVFFAFCYTPIISYVTARLEGMVGMALSIPFVREAGIILSGYKGIACWFLPFPIHNYGVQTVFYRQAELTGTKFISKWKADFFLVPFIIVCSILFAQLIWSMAPIPSSSYPYAETMWELQAKNQALMYSSTVGGYSQFREAFSGGLIAIGWVVGMAIFAVLKLISAPTLLLYGCVQGLNQSMPHTIIPQLSGALLAKFYIEKRLGVRSWRQFAPVLSAGFFCGSGLITMFCIGIMFLSKAVIKLPY